MQISSTEDTLIYNTVTVGTYNIVALRPSTTNNLRTAIFTFPDVNIHTRCPDDTRIAKILYDSASHVAYSVIAEFSVLAASILAALENIVWAIG